MNIGFVSTWFERGAAYVTKQYIDALKENNNVFVYARGGKEYGKGNPIWDLPYVTWGLKLNGTNINFKHIKRWIIKNKLDVIFFNEQHEPQIIAQLKLNMPHIKIGSYIDYYKEDTVEDFLAYDFLICNTKRHYSVFKDHPQIFFVPWGVDINTFRPKKYEKKKITFFHSVGMSKRKGTSLLIDAFIKGELYKRSDLIIHSQIDLFASFGYEINNLKQFNIHVIEETVTAPGLYHLGDVYVYPTTLDGLGLTVFEALACGLPVITTNYEPMNEVINENNGYLVDVEKVYSRSDGYYWPLSICNMDSLISGMKHYIEHQNELPMMRNLIRLDTENNLNWESRFSQINDIFHNVKILEHNREFLLKIYNKKDHKIGIREFIVEFAPDQIKHLIKTVRR